jgi:hypothetical protein
VKLILHVTRAHKENISFSDAFWPQTVPDKELKMMYYVFDFGLGLVMHSGLRLFLIKN